ncbi:MAG: 50S ribosomal protein L6 [Firmicutes bacterium HGW-Firmicutes-21]|nr:MAG: 50S ribosomal protein L6 [Firmicutes bacterium HGW-Firmicutes-21]
MSRIGRMPIAVPAGVTVTVGEENLVTVNGPKGTLSQKLPLEMIIEQEDSTLSIKRPSEEKKHKSLHGLTRTLVNNMVVGVTDGFKKQLDINGVGYKAAKQGKQLVLNLGYSHNIVIEEPAGISFEVPSPTMIIISGSNKQQVGQIAAEIRSKRPPEPYLGKGVKYSDEKIRRKAGKAGKK